MEKNTTTKKVSSGPKRFMFSRENYTWMFIGIGIIALGFALMYGKEDIYDTRKLVLAPIVVLSGFAVEIYAIMKKPKED